MRMYYHAKIAIYHHHPEVVILHERIGVPDNVGMIGRFHHMNLRDDEVGIFVVQFHFLHGHLPP